MTQRPRDASLTQQFEDLNPIIRPGVLPAPRPTSTVHFLPHISKWDPDSIRDNKRKKFGSGTPVSGKARRVEVVQTPNGPIQMNQSTANLGYVPHSSALATFSDPGARSTLPDPKIRYFG